MSVVLLTWNEAENIQACLDALAAQTDRRFEILVVDAASTDGTPDIVRRNQDGFPVPIRLHAAATRIPIGHARNLAVARAASPNVAFLSADAEPDPAWVRQALRHLESADMVFGRQVHAPHRWTIGAAVRGMRYHFPDEVPADALRYASNVGAAYRKDILTRFPFDPWANAAEDLLLARRARNAGYRASYAPEMTVRHHDVATLAQEARKNRREGHGWGIYRGELGLFGGILAWGLALLIAVAWAIVAPGWASLLVLAGVLWLPALRRAVRRAGRIPAGWLAVGVIATPPFDLLFLVHYVRGLLKRRPAAVAVPPETQEVPQ